MEGKVKEEKEKRKERYKSHKIVAHVFVEKPPREPILAKFCMSREMADVITRANFGVYRLRGQGYTGGRILAFPIKMASHL